MSDLEFELESTVDAPHEARETIRASLADRLPATTLYDLLTVVSELVANGVTHGRGDTVEVRITVDGDGRVLGEVENEGSGVVEPGPVDVRGGRGLGLRIVAAIVEQWRVFANHSTRVRFVLRGP